MITAPTLREGGGWQAAYFINTAVYLSNEFPARILKLGSQAMKIFKKKKKPILTKLTLEKEQIDADRH